jgi:hypothetical protein
LVLALLYCAPHLERTREGLSPFRRSPTLPTAAPHHRKAKNAKGEIRIELGRLQAPTLSCVCGTPFVLPQRKKREGEQGSEESEEEEDSIPPMFSRTGPPLVVDARVAGAGGPRSGVVGPRSSSAGPVVVDARSPSRRSPSGGTVVRPPAQFDERSNMRADPAPWRGEVPGARTPPHRATAAAESGSWESPPVGVHSAASSSPSSVLDNEERRELDELRRWKQQQETLRELNFRAQEGPNLAPDVDNRQGIAPARSRPSSGEGLPPSRLLDAARAHGYAYDAAEGERNSEPAPPLQFAYGVDPHQVSDGNINGHAQRERQPRPAPASRPRVNFASGTAEGPPPEPQRSGLEEDQLVIEDLDASWGHQPETFHGQLPPSQLPRSQQTGPSRAWATPPTTPQADFNPRMSNELSPVPVIVPSPITGYGERDARAVQSPITGYGERDRHPRERYQSQSPPPRLPSPSPSLPSSDDEEEGDGNLLVLPSMALDDELPLDPPRPSSAPWSAAGPPRGRSGPAFGVLINAWRALRDRDADGSCVLPVAEFREALSEAGVEYGSQDSDHVMSLISFTDDDYVDFSLIEAHVAVAKSRGERAAIDGRPSTADAAASLKVLNDRESSVHAITDERSRAQQELKDLVFLHSSGIYEMFREFDSSRISQDQFIDFLREILGGELDPSVRTTLAERSTTGAVSYSKLLKALCVVPIERYEGEARGEFDMAAQTRARAQQTAPVMLQSTGAAYIPPTTDSDLPLPARRRGVGAGQSELGGGSMAGFMNDTRAPAGARAARAPAAIVETPSEYTISLRRSSEEARQAKIQALRALVRTFVGGGVRMNDDGWHAVAMNSMSQSASGADAASAFRSKLQELGVPVTSQIERLIQRAITSGATSFKELFGAIEEATKAHRTYDLGDGSEIAAAEFVEGATVTPIDPNGGTAENGLSRHFESTLNVHSGDGDVSEPVSEDREIRLKPDFHSTVDLGWDEEQASRPFEPRTVDLEKLAEQRPEQLAMHQRMTNHHRSHLEFDDSLAGAAGVGLSDGGPAQHRPDQRHNTATRRNILTPDVDGGPTKEEVDWQLFGSSRRAKNDSATTMSAKIFSQSSHASATAVGEYDSATPRPARQHVPVDPEVTGHRYSVRQSGLVRPEAPFGTLDSEVENPHFFNLSKSMAKRHGPFARTAARAQTRARSRGHASNNGHTF